MDVKLSPAAALGALSPLDTIRSIVANAIRPSALPPTKRFEVHNIRGLTPEKVVAFAPEFVYMLDAGLGAVAGVVLSYAIRGLGDPTFPDFSTFGLRSIQSWSDDDIIFPADAGKLLVNAVPGTPPANVIAGLAAYTVRVSEMAPDLYGAEVVPFTEIEVADRIRKLPFVDAVSLSGIVRIIDGVTWQQTRVA